MLKFARKLYLKVVIYSLYFCNSYMPSIRNCFKGNDKGMLKVKEYKPIYCANIIKENRSRPQRKKIIRDGEG